MGGGSSKELMTTEKINEMIKERMTEAQIQLVTKYWTEEMGKNRLIYFGDGVRLPVYMLSQQTEKENKRRADIINLYKHHLADGLEPLNDDKMNDIVWPVITVADFATPQTARMGNRADVNPLYKDLWDTEAISNVERSHGLSFLSFLLHVIHEGHEAALFMENDINFIPIVDNHVWSHRDKKKIPWDDIEKNPQDNKNYEYSANEFRSRFVNAVKGLNFKEEDVVYIGGALGNGDFQHKAENIDETVVVDAVCTMGTHALIVTQIGAQKLVNAMIPLKYRTDSAIFMAKNVKRIETVPYLIGQELLWDVFKEFGGSTIASNYGALRHFIKHRLCSAKLAEADRIISSTAFKASAATVGGLAALSAAGAIGRSIGRNDKKEKGKKKKKSNQNRSKSISKKRRLRRKKSRTSSSRKKKS